MAPHTSQTRMEERFKEFRMGGCQSQEDTAPKALKHAKYEMPYIYKRKGNEEQTTFNAKLDKIAEVQGQWTYVLHMERWAG